MDKLDDDDWSHVHRSRLSWLRRDRIADRAKMQKLQSELESRRFSRIYKHKTAAYGLFAARCQHEPSRSFTRQEAIFAKTTPFLRGRLWPHRRPRHRPAHCLDCGTIWRASWTGRTWQRFWPIFGRRTRQEDPVVHFLRGFPGRLRPKTTRSARRLLQRPNRSFSYIVRSVDHLLRDRFGLADGLADTATVTVERPGGEQEDPAPRVLILDPAAGTGTFSP